MGQHTAKADFNGSRIIRRGKPDAKNHRKRRWLLLINNDPQRPTPPAQSQRAA